MDAEEHEAQESRAQDRDGQTDVPVGHGGAAAQGALAGGQHGDQDAGRDAADARKEGGAGGEGVAGVAVGAEGGDHAPVGDVAHGVGDAEEEVHEAEEPHEGPPLELGVEGGIDDQRGGDHARQYPGLELAVLAPGALDDVAHDGVVQSVEDPGAEHDGRDGGELARGEVLGEEHEGQQKVGDQGVDHVPAHGAQGEHDQILSVAFGWFHKSSSVMHWLAKLYHFSGKKATGQEKNEG